MYLNLYNRLLKFSDDSCSEAYELMSQHMQSIVYDEEHEMRNEVSFRFYNPQEHSKVRDDGINSYPDPHRSRRLQNLLGWAASLRLLLLKS